MTSNEHLRIKAAQLKSYLDSHALTYLSFSDLYTYEIIILFIYGIMIMFSFFTNSISIIIFFFGRRSRSELTPFLLNLSLFNIIMTTYCIPFTITSVIFQRWLFARALCVVLDSFKTFSVSGVLLTLITIAIDRYCVLKYPLTIKIYSAKKRNFLAILIIWILSICLAIVWSPARSIPREERRLWVNSQQLLHNYVRSSDNTSDPSESLIYLDQIRYRLIDTVQCVPNKGTPQIEVQRTILNFLQTYFIPFFILAFVYLRIAVLLWQRRNDVNYDINSNSTNKNLFTNENIQFKKKLKKGIKMLVALVILYAVLWLPMNVFQLSYILLCHEGTPHTNVCSNSALLKLLYIIAHFLTVSNTALNPIIYGFANARFRSDIRQLRRRLFHCQGRAPLYFQARFTRVHREHPNDQCKNLQEIPNLLNSSHQRTTRKLSTQRPVSLTDQIKKHRTPYTNVYADKDNLITITRHTT